jgi:TetR/AcrR family transcriptional regulator, mexJK operon transcriptional repressor
MEGEMATPTSTGKPALSEEAGSSARKHRAILDAAIKVFLRNGFLGANMDEIAALSEVSKQTIYKHFSSKEALFVEIVTSMTDAASDTVHNEIPEVADDKDIAGFLQMYAHRQLTVVLTPRLMQLRRPNWQRSFTNVDRNVRSLPLRKLSSVWQHVVCLLSMIR